jgi:hypothetical protein
VVIYFSWCTILQNLRSVKQRVLKILSSQYIHMSNLTLWPFNLKINRGHLLFRMYQYIKFEVCQAKGSQNIERKKIFLFPVWNDLDLKINRSLPLLITNPHMKYHNGSQDTERTSSGLPTVLPTGAKECVPLLPNPLAMSKLQPGH